jgi:hypothetical protein
VLSPRLFLLTRVRWGVQPGENHVEAQLEFQIDPQLFLRTLIGDALQGSAELVWRRQF